MIGKKNKNRMCFIIQFRNWVVPRTSPCRGHFRMLLGRPWYISLTFMRKWRNSIFSLPVRMLKLYFKNVLVMIFMEGVNIDIRDILRKSKWRAHIGTCFVPPWNVSQKLYAILKLCFMFPSIYLPISLYV